MSEINRLLAEAAKRLEAAGVERPLFEAQLLMSLTLGVSRLEILRGPASPLTDAQYRCFHELVTERQKRVPLAYLRGTQEFYGLEFEVSPAVLVPRPETELLVDLAIEELGGREGAALIDVGTGSGCIAVAAAAHLQHSRVLGIDVSTDALAVALRNAERNRVANWVRFVQGDMLNSVASGSADMIVSNPPYIPSDEVASLQPEVRKYEPHIALDGGRDGLMFHRKLIAGARRVLKPGGAIGIEVALGQADTVSRLLSAAEFSNITALKDLAGIDRVVTGCWEPGTSSR